MSIIWGHTFIRTNIHQTGGRATCILIETLGHESVGSIIRSDYGIISTLNRRDVRKRRMHEPQSKG